MLDFENLDGFVVDLTTEETTNNELKCVLENEEDREGLTFQEKRDLILKYYFYTYYDSYVFVKAPNVYQIVEDNTITRNTLIKKIRHKFLIALADEVEDSKDLEKVKCYFTAYCLDFDINCATSEYDILNNELYNNLKNKTIGNDITFKDFESFDLWLGEHLY